MKRQKWENHRDWQRRYAIRKLSIGAASVAIGLFLGGKPVLVHADAVQALETTKAVTAESEKPAAATQQEEKPAANVDAKVEMPVAAKEATEKKNDSAEQAKPVEKEPAKTAEVKNDATKTAEKNDADKPEAKDEKVADEKTAAKQGDAKKDAATVDKLLKSEAKAKAKDVAKAKAASADADTESKVKMSDWAWSKIPNQPGYMNQGDVTIDNYKGHDADVVMPNTSDFVEAGIIDSTHKVILSFDGFKKIIQHQGLNSLTIDTDDPANLGAKKSEVYASASAPSYTGPDETKFIDSSNPNPWDAWDYNHDYDSLRPKDPTVKILNLNGLDVSGFTNMSRMFYGASSLEKIDISDWDTSNVTDFRLMFDGALRLKEIDAPNLVTGKATQLGSMFSSNRSLITLDANNWDLSNVKSLEALFSGETNLTTLKAGNWKTDNVQNMAHLFQGTHSLKNWDFLKNWHTQNVRTMEGMFRDSYVGKDYNNGTLDLSNWNVSNVTRMDEMFHGARWLKKLNTTNWDTSKLQNIHGMFQADVEPPEEREDPGLISKLTTIEGIGHWNVSNVTDASYLFNNCIALTDQGINGIQNWQLPKLDNLQRAFRNTRSLTKLDLHNWFPKDTKDLPNWQLPTLMQYTFAGSNVTYLNLSGWAFPAANVSDSKTRGIFDHLGQGQPVLIVLNDLKNNLILNSDNLSTDPNTDRANSDLPIGPMVIIASDLSKVQIAKKLDDNTFVSQNIDDSNNHWSENQIKIINQNPEEAAADKDNFDWTGWLQDHGDDPDLNTELDNLRFAFKDEKEAENYLLGLLNNYLNNHNLTGKVAKFTGHSTYYAWFWGSDFNTGQQFLDGGRAKTYDPHWIGEGIDGSGTGDDFWRMYTADYQDEMTTGELPMTKQDLADAVNSADPNHANSRHQPANLLMMLLAAQPTSSKNWPANLLPLLLSGYYTVTDKPKEPETQTVTVTVEYRDSKTHDLVQNGESRSGKPGDTITFNAFTAPSGFHIVAPVPSTSYTFGEAKNQTVTVWVEKDTIPPKDTVTVTVVYKDKDTGETVKTDKPISGQTGKTITLTFTAPDGYHIVDPVPSTSYTFGRTSGTVTVLVQKDGNQPDIPYNPNTNPDNKPDLPDNPEPDDKPDTPDNPKPDVPKPHKPQQPAEPSHKTHVPAQVAKQKVPNRASITYVQKGVPTKKSLPQTSDSKAANILGVVALLDALAALGFGAKKKKRD